MKKNTFLIFLLSVMLISIISCDTITYYTVKVSVDRHPTLTIVNQTGYPVTVTAPMSIDINHNARTQYQPREADQNMNVTYTINQIPFTEQVTWNNTDTSVTLTKRPPTVIVVNQTGRQVIINSPISTSIGIGARTQFLPPVLTGNFNIAYSSGLMELSEQVTMNNQDVTVNLTVGAPTLTVVNNVGATINTIFLRTPGSPTWTGGNIVIRGGIVNLAAAGGARTGDISGSIVNRDSMQIWMGNISLSGDRFDIRIDDVQGATYVKSNVQIRSDMTITFTVSDRR